MPKPNKSSASSGTRKKHAKKNAPTDEDDHATPSGPRQRGQKKLSKAQKKALPKIKRYVPPPKPPAPPIPDPLDGMGLARTLPAELVVVLRRLGKKDEVTRRKGLEDLKEAWIGQLLSGSKDEDDVERELKETALVAAVPVWLHNLASLLQSPFHRSMAIQLHSDLLSIPSTRTAILDSLTLSLLPGTQNRDILGSWLVAALEEGRRAGGVGLKSWDGSTVFVVPGSDTDGASGKVDLTPQIPTLVEYLSLSILDPTSLHDDIHPAPVTSAPLSTQTVKGSKAGKARALPAMATAAPVGPSEDEELAEERWARYRVGGLTALSWLIGQIKSSHTQPPPELLNLLRTPLLWTALSSASPAEDIQILGYQQSPVRRAGYALLSTLVESYPSVAEEKEMAEMLSLAVLGNCWTEKEATVWETAGQAVVKFLSKYPMAWQSVLDTEARLQGHTGSGSTTQDEAKLGSQEGDKAEVEDEEDDEDDDDEDEGDEAKSSASIEPVPSEAKIGSSSPFDAFLEFISTICPSLPHLTYPLLLVVISTIPDTLLPLSPPPSLPLRNLFSHLWSAVDARLLSTHSLPGQPSAFQAFLRDAVDVTAFLIGRASRREGGKETAEWIVKDQLGGRVWIDGVLLYGGRAGVRRGLKPIGGNETEAGVFAQAVTRIATIDSDLVDALMPLLRKGTLEACFPEDEEKGVPLLPRSLAIIASVRSGAPNVTVQKTLDDITRDIASGCVQRLLHNLEAGSSAATVYAETLVEILRDQFQLIEMTEVEKLAHELKAQTTSFVQALTPDLSVALFEAVSSVKGTTDRGALYTAIWGQINSSNTSVEKRFALTTSILGREGGTLLKDGSLDDIIEEAVQAALAGSDSARTLAITCIEKEKHISADALHTVLALLSTSTYDTISDLLSTKTDSSSVPTVAIDILAAYAKTHLSDIVDSDINIRALIAIHHLLFVVPRIHGQEKAQTSTAQDLWSLTKNLDARNSTLLGSRIDEELADQLITVTSRADPGVLIDVALLDTLARASSSTSTSHIAERLLPPITSILETVNTHAVLPPSPELPIVDPLVAYTPQDTDAISRSSDYDVHGRSKAARLIEGVTRLLRADKQLTTKEPDLLRAILLARVLLQDAQVSPKGSRGFLASTVAPAYLDDAIREIDGVLSYALTSVDDTPVAWHKATISVIQTSKGPSNSDWLQRLLLALADGVRKTSGDVPARALRDVLARHLRQSGASSAEGEIWLQFTTTLMERAPQLGLAILLAIKPLIIDTQALAVMQNRLGSTITALTPAKGLPVLRLLTATDSPGGTYLPQQRAVFVLRHLATWLASEDDDLPEDMELRVVEFYVAVAPVVQDLSGGHWDSMFDLIESGLEYQNSSLDDPSTSALLYQCLVLLKQIRDLSSTNKSLKALWTGKDAQLKLVLKLFLQCRNADSTPLQMIQTLLLDLLQDVSEDIVGDSGLPELCGLLRLSSSSTVQCTAYRLLSQVVKRRTVALVLEVEASVGEAEAGNASREIRLPDELVDIAKQGVNVDWQGEGLTIESILGQLLSWMAILDHFDDASRTLRWAYMDQLNSSKLIDESLIPLLFAMLGVSEVGAWNFPACQFAVDEFYTDLLQPEELADLVPLASHLFYRALVTIPSSIRTYYESLKNRQLSMSLLAFTARHYSPVIIAHEFSAIREPSAMAQLTDEGLNVRIAQGGGAVIAGGGSAEAIASHVVDEQPMEIGIRLPAEFPLRGVEIRDLKRVGVPENKWRGWLMSVQQTITSRNGLILEALTVFKKNVALHFEGVVECAICYSIISLTDRTLPTKPCRTCKNRFHASCLFKWFNSSHSSSCPLCRALF